MNIYYIILDDAIKKYKINIVEKKRCFESFYQLRFWLFVFCIILFIFVSTEKLFVKTIILLFHLFIISINVISKDGNTSEFEDMNKIKKS